MIRKLIIAASALAVAACTTVGPNYSSPAPAAPAQQPFLGAASPAFTGDEPPGRWWSLFGDPLLEQLVEQALARNTDLRVAAANLAQARAVLRETRAGRLPTTGLSGGATFANPPGPGGVDLAFDAGIDVGYQLDLFGRIRRASEASRADVEAVQAAFDLTRITVAAETTRAYADACAAGRQLGVARESVRIQEETFDLTQRLVRGGRGTALETGQAQAQLEQTRSQIPTLEAQRSTALYRLSVLTGRPPAEFPRDLAAATARVGVATADLDPQIGLGGAAGAGSGVRFSLGPLISWSFPNRSVARARIAQAQASAEAALARFDGAWLAALEETEGALARHAAELDRVEILRRARAGSAEAARIARLRYRAGREPFQIVLEAERTLSQAEASAAQAEAQRSDTLISLFLALGGGWQPAG
jgi:outer membrane protein TolC